MDRCASCGKSGDGLKACTACKLVKYCDVACQRAHRPAHKRACRKRAAELHDEALFATPPPREDCPICFLRLPQDNSHRLYQLCCRKVLCIGCAQAAQKEAGRRPSCPFCRSPALEPDVILEKLKASADAGYAQAIFALGNYHHRGDKGFPMDRKRAVEHWIRAGKCGLPDAYCSVGSAYSDGVGGVERDMVKARYYWELAAMGGDESARYNLGLMELKYERNIYRSVKHFMIAAGAGEHDSLNEIRKLYLKKMVTKNVFEKALRLHQQAMDEMKSDQRDEALAYLASVDNEPCGF